MEDYPKSYYLIPKKKLPIASTDMQMNMEMEIQQRRGGITTKHCQLDANAHTYVDFRIDIKQSKHHQCHPPLEIRPSRR